MEFIWLTLPVCLFFTFILALPSFNRQRLTVPLWMMWSFALIAIWLIGSVFMIPFTSVTNYTVRVAGQKAHLYSWATATMQQRIWKSNIRDRNHAYKVASTTLRISDINGTHIEIVSGSKSSQEDILQQLQESAAFKGLCKSDQERIVHEMNGLMNALKPVSAPSNTPMFKKMPSVDIHMTIEANDWTYASMNLIIALMFSVTIGVRWAALR